MMRTNLGLIVLVALLTFGGCFSAEESSTETETEEITLELTQVCPQDTICQYCLEYTKTTGDSTTFGAANVSSYDQAKDLLRRAGTRRGKLSFGTCAEQSTGCTKEYRPVCDSETATTYGNECAIKAMIRQEAGVNGKARTTYSSGECSTSATCTHDGATYQAGESFLLDCNTCICGENGGLSCTRMLCTGR